MDVQKLAELYPRIFHMAEAGTWLSIRQRGLLSTSAVLNLFDITGEKRFALESTHRPQKVTVGEGSAAIVLRDQNPMAPGRLQQALPANVSTQVWYEAINRKVFFWAEEKRLLGLLNARAYRNLEHDVLTINTAALLAKHAPSVWLCHMNSANTFPMPHPRDLSAFQRIENYPVNAQGRPIKQVVEVLVDDQVPDIRDFVLEVRRMRGSEVLSEIRK